MRISRRNVKKLASLSALGAGAVAVGGQQAYASIIYSGVIDAKVGFGTGSGFGSRFTSPVLGTGAKFIFKTTSVSQPLTRHRTTAHFTRGIRGSTASGRGLKFATTGGFPFFRFSLFNAGAKFSSAVANSRTGLVAQRKWGISTFSKFHTVSGASNGNFTDKYALFKFQSGAQTDYGWILLSDSVTSAFGDKGTFGPNLTIVSYAYDTSGAEIPAGETSSPIPEPNTLALSGLGALAMGAVGLRRWRKARNAA